MSNEALVYTIPEAAELLHIHKNTLYDLVKRGEVPSIRLGTRRVVIPKKALHRILEAHE
jgi:excisionase family DNA binding protein